MIAVQIDDDVAGIVKQAAKEEHRTIKGQMRHYLVKVLKDEGRLNVAGNKKADATVESIASASV